MEKIKQLTQKQWILLTGCIVAAICIITAGMLLGSAAEEKRLTEQLEMGEKYLAELDYENAIVAYEIAIQIDPKCEEAYIQLAEAYVAIGNVDKAIENLKKGIELTDSESLKSLLEELEGRQRLEAEKLAQKETVEEVETQPETTVSSIMQIRDDKVYFDFDFDFEAVMSYEFFGRRIDEWTYSDMCEYVKANATKAGTSTIADSAGEHIVPSYENDEVGWNATINEYKAEDKYVDIHFDGYYVIVREDGMIFSLFHRDVPLQTDIPCGFGQEWNEYFKKFPEEFVTYMHGEYVEKTKEKWYKKYAEEGKEIPTSQWVLFNSDVEIKNGVCQPGVTIDGEECFLSDIQFVAPAGQYRIQIHHETDVIDWVVISYK